jgi:GDP-L-fucose synthase
MTNNFKIKKIFIAGGTGFLGKRVIKRLEEEKLPYVTTSLSLGVDFRDYNQTEKYFSQEKPDILINCAAYVGGIKFGMEHEGEIYFNNTLINLNLFECARKFGVKRIINPISNCSYPDVLQKDFKEDEWWDGPLHRSVLVYGFVKKATWVLSVAYKSQYNLDVINFLVPNMYGPGDHFEEIRSHALGALIMKISKAKENKEDKVIIWGTGKPIREWLYVDDCVEAFIRALYIHPEEEPINIGQGKGISISDLANIIKEVVGYKGEFVYDTSKPDGAPYKIMNVEKCKKIFNWYPDTELKTGIKKTVKWYYENILKKEFNSE